MLTNSVTVGVCQQVKGIGIILVDIGHNGVANENYIYLFHMAHLVVRYIACP